MTFHTSGEKKMEVNELPKLFLSYNKAMDDN